MRIFIAADHGGYELKNIIREHLTHNGYEIEDLGAHTYDPEDDYPQYAFTLAGKLLGGDDDDLGILICKSGQGMAIAANRLHGIRAAIAWNPAVAAHARADDNVNVLVLGAMYTDTDLCLESIDAWLGAKFKSDNPKYQRRLDQIEELYG